MQPRPRRASRSASTESSGRAAAVPAASPIAMQEASGKDYVIRPPIPLEIGAMERDPDQLRRVYETGRAVAQIQIDKIKAFLDAAKAEPEA